MTNNASYFVVFCNGCAHINVSICNRSVLFVGISSFLVNCKLLLFHSLVALLLSFGLVAVLLSFVVVVVMATSLHSTNMSIMMRKLNDGHRHG